MGLFNKFTDTIFLKESSSLEEKYNALSKLSQEYPDREDIKEELYIVKKGLDGEREIHYQLEKANIGMYVLHDINFEFEGQKAQVDYIVVTRLCSYFIECKNLIGNITITDKGDFIREYIFNNKKIKKGMYSPFRQVEAQRDVFKKIWNTKLSKNSIINSIKRSIGEKYFETYNRVLVVAANNETILNTRYAPSDMKYKIIKADALIRQIKYDIEHSHKDNWSNDKVTKEWAESFLKLSVSDNTNYYEYYKEKYDLIVDKEKIRNELITLRTNRSKEMNIPAYYVFTNEELDKIVKDLPKSVRELDGILPPIKIKIHGKEIVDVINKTVL